MRLIDAKALMSALMQNRYHHANTEREKSLLQRCEDIVNEQPTIEAVPVVHGEWVENDNGCRVCSVCDSEAYWDTDYGQQLFGWCPYCGARMT